MTQDKRPFENLVEKREKAGNTVFSPFPIIFLTLQKTNFKF